MRLAAIAVLVCAMSAAAQAPSFAVTSVKPSGGDPQPFGITFDGGQAKLWSITAADMLRDAFGLTTNDQLPGLPDWAAKDHWDINATEDEAVAKRLATGPMSGRIELMHQLILELLHDRFALKESKTTRVLPAYELSVAKSGIRMTQSADPTKGFTGFRGGNSKMIAQDAPIGALVNRMSVMPEVQGHPIVDRTGLTGKYDWTLTWTAELSAPDPQASDAPGLFEALQQQLGLRLVPAKTAVPAVQIDSIARPAAD